MPLVTLSAIKKSFGAREVLRDASFTIEEKERAALIGPNGSGKTTLLRIICREELPDSGSLIVKPDITIGYLPQETDLPDQAPLLTAVLSINPEISHCIAELERLEKQIRLAHGEGETGVGARYAELSHRFDSLGGYDCRARACAILSGLGFKDPDFEKPVSLLSGGQKTRAALARLLLHSPDLLLLDEPTNHLDISACEWLQEFLTSRYTGAALIVSHDRYFLDRVVTRVAAIEDGLIVTYHGGYTDYVRQRAEKIEEQQRAYRNRQKEIARIEAAIQTLFSHRKFSRRDSKLRQLQRLERVEKAADERRVSIKARAAVRSGREVLRLSGLSKSYAGKTLFSGVDFVLERGHKIGVVGPNGSGKTTLLKIISGREDPDSGEVAFGHKVVPVYFAQEFDHLDPDRTVLEELLADSEISAREARDLLARFLFMGDDVFKKVEMLSGGEQCRLALAKVLADRPNLLLLDEPTNHLDIQSREALEAALRDYDGTLMTASHDRYLLDAVTTDIVEISRGSFTHYHGNYSSYREKKSAQQTEPRAPQHTDTKAAAVRPTSALRENERLLRQLEKKRAQLEAAADELESLQSRLAEALGSEEVYRSGTAGELTREYDRVSAELDSIYQQWEEVCERSEEIRRLLSN